MASSQGILLGAPCADEEAAGPGAAAEPDYIEMKGIRLSGTPLYLDMQATTPMDPRVLDAMLPYMVDKYGNPHSRTHAFGWETEDSIEVARKQVGNKAVYYLTHNLWLRRLHCILLAWS